MISIKEIVVSVVFTSVAIGLCELLVPDNSYKNTIRLITGAVMLISIITPLTKDFEFENIDFSSNSINIDVSGATEKSVALATKNEITDVLKENNIEKAKIIITTGCDENSSIIVDKACILFDKKDKSNYKEISSIIFNRIGIKVECGELNE